MHDTYVANYFVMVCKHYFCTYYLYDYMYTHLRHQDKVWACIIILEIDVVKVYVIPLVANLAGVTGRDFMLESFPV